MKHQLSLIIKKIPVQTCSAIHPDSVCCYKETKESNNFGFRKQEKTTASKQMSTKKKRRKTQGDAVPPTFVISPVVKFLVVI